MNLENNSLDDDQLGRVRTPQEVAKRALVLIGIFQAATGRNKEAVIKILKKNSLWSEVSELEKKFLETSDDESKFISMQYSWRSESIYILLWALEHFDFEAIPKDEKNLEKIGNLLKTDDFHKIIEIKNAHLRSSNEIYKILDEVSKLNWEIRDAFINKEEPQKDYHPSIIYEWHYSLSWLTKPNEEWDSITTDT